MPILQLTLHQELWNWLADNPERNKEDWPKWGYMPEVQGDCFACEYSTASKIDTISECPEACPFIWPVSVWCLAPTSLYAQYRGCSDMKKRAELARQIANLPVKAGVPCE